MFFICHVFFSFVYIFLADLARNLPARIAGEHPSEIMENISFELFSSFL